MTLGLARPALWPRMNGSRAEPGTEHERRGKRR